jgi:CheY-like chemotaxis protein
VGALAAHQAESRESILVVDDDPQILRMVSESLRRVGYQVQTATCAAEALALHATSRHQPFGLILSDVVMPQTTGIELARHLLSRDDQVRLLFMSGMVGSEALRRDLDIGVGGREVGLLTKPFAVEGLLRAVRTALGGPPPATGTASTSSAASAASAASERRGSSPPPSEPSALPAVRPSTSRSMQR